MKKGKLALVADDSRTARLFLCSILEREGCQTVQAENGLEVLRNISEVKPDILILDLLMPEMDGLEVLQNIKKLNLDIPIIVLTADIQEEVKEECFMLGAKGFVNKPFKENEFLDIFRNLILK